MVERDDLHVPSAGFGFAAVVVGAVLGAAALLLSTKQGKRILEQVGGRAEDWKAQAAASLAESLEKVVSSVESVSPSPHEFPSDTGPQVRTNP